MKRKLKPLKSTAKIAETTLNKVLSTMKRHSSRKTGKVSICRTEIATKANVSTAMVDIAVGILKRRSMLSKDKLTYVLTV